MELVAEPGSGQSLQLEVGEAGKRRRDGQGRFVEGNTFGSGHSCAQRQALVSRLMVEAATEEKIRETCEQIVAKAAAGGIEAAKLMFRYVMGKAVQGVACEAREQTDVVAAEEVAARSVAEAETVDKTVERCPGWLSEEAAACPSSAVGTVERVGAAGSEMARDGGIRASAMVRPGRKKRFLRSLWAKKAAAELMRQSPR